MPANPTAAITGIGMPLSRSMKTACCALSRAAGTSLGNTRSILAAAANSATYDMIRSRNILEESCIA